MNSSEGQPVPILVSLFRHCAKPVFLRVSARAAHNGCTAAEKISVHHVTFFVGHGCLTRLTTRRGARSGCRRLGNHEQMYTRATAVSSCVALLHKHLKPSLSILPLQPSFFRLSRAPPSASGTHFFALSTHAFKMSDNDSKQPTSEVLIKSMFIHFGKRVFFFCNVA